MSLFPSVRPSVAHHISETVHMCKMMISLGGFFNFYKILIFWAIRGVKAQEIAQNEK